MRVILVCLFILFFSLAYTQTATLTPQHMHEDLDYLNKYLKKWHPTYYTYTKKEVMIALYQGLKDSCKRDLSELEFNHVVRKAVVKVGCGHMGIYFNNLPKDLKFLPLKVWILGNHMYIKSFNSQDTLLKVGDEILAINGENVDDFINHAKEITVSDGFNETYKIVQIENNTGIFHFFLHGQSPNYRLTLKNKEGRVSEVKINAVLEKEMKMTQTPKLLYDSSKLVIKGNAVNLYKTDFDSTTMLMDIDNFEGKRQYRSFRQIFKHLKVNKIQNLVIDLRNNGGGNIFKGNKFLTYLLDQPVIPFVISRKPNLTPLNPRLKGKFLEKITPALFMTFTLQFPNKNGWNHLFLFFKQSRNHFDGKIYVLTNGGSFSMASYVTSYLKHKRKAVVIGTETGGSEYASRSSASGYIQLPNSKIKVRLNLYQTKHYVGIEDKEHGILPDYPTLYGIEDKVNNVDLDMEVVKTLIKK
jgi:Peptidase family S41